MLFVALGAVVAAASATFAAFHVRSLGRALRPDLPTQIIKLKRTPPAERPAALLSAMPPGSWEAHLAESIASSPSEPLKAAAANESLGDLALLFTSRSRWAPSAVRIALLGALLFGALAIIKSQLVEAVVSVVVCAVGAGICGLFSSRAARLEREQRQRADDLVETLLPGAAREESVGRRYRGAV